MKCTNKTHPSTDQYRACNYVHNHWKRLLYVLIQNKLTHKESKTKFFEPDIKSIDVKSKNIPTE